MYSVTDKLTQAAPSLEGAKLPDFELLDGDGRLVTLAEMMGPKGLVLALAHGTFCPHCVRQLRRLNEIAPELEAHQVGLAGVTHDSIDRTYAYVQSVRPPLRYLLLADVEASLAGQLGVLDSRYMTPYPAIFLIDPDRIFRYADVSYDHDSYPNIGRLLELVKSDQG